MELLKFIITKQNIVCDRKSLVSDTKNVYECLFEFDEEWNGYQKWAVFKQGDNAYKVLLDNDFCIMPSQAIVDKGHVVVGVYGVQADRRYPTIYTFPILVQESCADGVLPPAPTPSEWEQVLEYMSKIDNFESYIPEGTSEENQLVNQETLDNSVQSLDENKVDKVQGKGLSTNDFTNADKSKLDSLENYDDTSVVNRISQNEADISELDTSKQDNITDLQTIREGAELGASAVQPNELDNYYTKQESDELLDDKVDKVEGKQLTDVNFSQQDKTKLDSLENYDDTELTQRVSTNETDISNLQTDKEDKTVVSALTERVSTNEDDIESLSSTKEDKTTVNALSQRVDTNEDDITDLQSNKEDKSVVSALSQRVGTNEDNISSLDGRLDNAEDDIDTIESKIPNQATSTNQLADKEFVNSSISSNTATFQGTFSVEDLGLTYEATKEQIESALDDYVGVKTNNDYVFVYITNPTTQIIEKYDRFKFTSDDNTWNYEYELNNSSFTANQWNAINSGITSLLVAQITNNQTAITNLNTSLSNLASRVGNNEQSIATLNTNVASLQSSKQDIVTTSKGIEKSGVDIRLKQSFYDYLDNATYQKPTISVFDILNASGVSIAGSYENGTHVSLEKFKHRETNIDNIEGVLTFKNGNTSVMTTNKTSSDTTIELDNAIDISSNATFYLTCKDTKNNTIQASKSLNFYDYIYTTLNQSTEKPTTATKGATVSTFASSGATFNYNVGDYLWILSPQNNKKIQTNVLGQWADVVYHNEGSIEFTKDNGVVTTYYCYRTDRFNAQGSAVYRLV